MSYWSVHNAKTLSDQERERCIESISLKQLLGVVRATGRITQRMCG